MQTLKPKFSRTFFISLLVITAATIIIANYFGEMHAVLASSFLNLVITTPLAGITIALLARDRLSGSFGRAWACFTCFVVLWFVAERIWMIYDLVYHADPWPSEADVFWFAGYPAYFAFAVFYLQPFRSSISKKLMASALGVTVVIAGLLIYNTSLQESEISYFEEALGLAYPVLDAVSIAPIIIGLALFLRGQVSFLWSCLFIGMLCFVVADYGFIFFSLDETYYTGHVIDIPYMWAYLFFLAGTYNNAKIFKMRTNENRFNDQERFR